MNATQDSRFEKDACMVNKQQSSIPRMSSEFSSESVGVMGTQVDKKGDFSSHSVIPSDEILISDGNSGSAGTLASTEKAGSTAVGVLREEGTFPMPTPLFSTSFKAKAMASLGGGIMEDGFIKVTKKKKKNNGPKPRVQIPSLHVSKPDPSKPLGRARPNVITRVTVSNPFKALNDVNQIDYGFPELNATLKKFAMRYVKEKTIPDPDVFKTWSTDLKEYYYSLIKDDGEEVESKTDGTAKMMSTGVS
ncbi:hypothetical protein L1987_32946 [Smallanthus sonchifolius]|uniref:Uncharacterized protein n=1 Tax=Smallanthus sonchifolius TaxID=185202 RepID=A0ACB9HQH6_9ASTR|nr:hypothetical protein L1987_32946 [Smallanthus sonchifolius]